MKKNQFKYVDFIKISENQMDEYTPIKGSFAIVKCSDQYLIGYNIYRNQWELPAGKREINETAKECAIRELYEETSQCVSDMIFKGLLKTINTISGEVKYNPVYVSQISKLQPFKANEEISEIKLWDLKESIGTFDELDFHLFHFV